MDSYTLEQSRIANRKKSEDNYQRARQIVKDFDKGKTVITTDEFTVRLWSTNDKFRDRGSFEHNMLGEDCGGGLWFDESGLYDYDGVYALPKKVIKMLESEVINCEYAKD
jgi:hypothetical protein